MRKISEGILVIVPGNTEKSGVTKFGYILVTHNRR